MSDIFIKLFNMSITASWVVLAVILIRLVLKKSPKWIRGILWALVALRLVCPFSIESILSLIPSTETVPENIIYTDSPMIHTGINTVNSAVNPILSEVLAPTPEKSVTPMQTIAETASTVWLIGIGVMLIYAVISYIRVYRRTREGFESKERIYLCDRISSPFIFGIAKPKIYLPSAISEADAEYVIAHEKAHIKRHDYIWKPFAFLLLTVYWFNPVMWIAYILLSRDIELACDEKVIKEMGEESKKSYSNALINYSSKQRFVTACPVAFGEVGVKARIKSVLNYKKPAFWIIIVALIACVALTVFFLTDPKDDSRSPIGEENLKLRVTEIAYNNGIYSFVQSPETAPPYYITEDLVLQTENSFGGIRSYGKLEEIDLNDEKFDSRFELDRFPDIEEIKSENKRIWEVYSNEYFDLKELHIVLEQKDGTIYVGYGYYQSEAEKAALDEGRYLHYETAKAFGQNPDASHIRWLYKMETGKGSAVDTSADNPTFEATVTEVDEEWIRVEVPDGYDFMPQGELFIPNDYTVSGKAMPELRKDDKISVIFNGKIYDKDRREIYEVYSVSLVYDSPYSETVTAIGPTNAEIYMYHDSPDIISPALRLSKDDNTFSFTYSLFSSYLCIGTYERTDKELILHTDDGINTYYFDRNGDKYIFDQTRSSNIPKYRYGEGEEPQTPVPNGAVFESKALFDPAIDSIDADIDKDGKVEKCVLTYGPTSGIFSFYFSVYEDGILEYNELMTPLNHSDITFCEDERGNVCIKTTDDNGKEALISVVLENGHIYLYENGVEAYVASFSYEKAQKNFDGIVTTKNICPTDADTHKYVTNHARAIKIAAEELDREQAEITCVAYDKEAKMWWIEFAENADADGGCVSVYISYDGTQITTAHIE